MRSAQPTAITMQVLRSYYGDSKADDELQTILQRLRSTEEIIALEPEFLALVERGANLTPFHARKGETMDMAIPKAIADPAVEVLNNAIENLTAIRMQIADNTEGAEGAPEEVGEGMPDEVVQLLSAETKALQSLMESMAPAMADPDAEQVAEAAPDPDAEPVGAETDDAVPTKADDPAPAGAGILEGLAEEKRAKVLSALSSVLEMARSDTPIDELRDRMYAIMDALWSMSTDASILALSKHVAKSRTSTDNAEALATVHALTKRIDDHDTALTLLLDTVKALRGDIINDGGDADDGAA